MSGAVESLLALMPIGAVLRPFRPMRAKEGNNDVLGPTMPLLQAIVMSSRCTRQNLACLPPPNEAPSRNHNALVGAGAAAGPH